MGKQSGKRARTSAKAKDLGRIETWRAARVKGGAPAVDSKILSSALRNPIFSK